MLGLFVFCLVTGVVNGCTSCSTALNATLKELMLCKSHLVVGLSVSVVKSDKVLFVEGYSNDNTSVTGDTLFQIASLSKAFASTLLVKLIEEKTEYSMDTKIKTILRNDHIFNDSLRSEYTTVRDLLSHRTGIPQNNRIRLNTNLTRSNLIQLRRKALREDTTLEGLISSARALELSEKQATEIEQSDKQSANAVRKGVGKRRNGPRFLQTQTDQNVKKKTTCRNCGGSSINVIDESTFENIKCKPKLSHADTKVFAYGSDKNLKLMGKFHATIETDHKITTAPVYVMKGRYGNLLCYDTSVDLSIVPVISSVADKHEILCNKYSDVFNGIGKLKDEKVKIHIDGSVKPVIQPHRRIPFHIRKQVEAELEKLEKQDIIEKVDGPTPWVSPIVVAPKPKNKNEIRLMPAELFQNTLSNALEGLDGVRNISDDIIVFGRNQDEHDKRLEKLFARLKEKNLTLNKAKCEFNKNKLEFYGHIFSADGISADPRKISAIRNTTIPKDVGEIRSFLAMTNYVGRFIPNYSTITEPLRRLTKQDSKWEWTSEQQESFDKLKNELVADRVMSYFDPNKETMLIVDASPVGLAGLLTQNGKIIAYASRSLTDVETRYSQTEKEALAIVWAIEHFHLYLYGQSFTLVSDHQPLETIFNSPKAKTPARIERWRLRLQGYNFKVQYKPGKVNAADYLSRHPTPNTSIACKHSQLAEEYVRYLTDNAVPKAMTLNEIADSTQKDKDLQTVITALKSKQVGTSYGE
ncbi:Hypothetical predicted protein [Mytilus galloprovincialis]|uniref:Uncharacterized protein n=1 Tax=Mytilus galloprovincialis TaxID=29158 RepID=A0A8B6GYZ8_MYTGA|nr:Hypothetical predicted protein [Mytilus galloprovincialis]